MSIKTSIKNHRLGQRPMPVISDIAAIMAHRRTRKLGTKALLCFGAHDSTAVTAYEPKSMAL